MSDMYVIMVGTLLKGYKFYGPFASYDKAIDWVWHSEYSNSDWNAVALEEPC